MDKEGTGKKNKKKEKEGKETKEDERTQLKEKSRKTPQKNGNDINLEGKGRQKRK